MDKLQMAKRLFEELNEKTKALAEFIEAQKKADELFARLPSSTDKLEASEKELPIAKVLPTTPVVKNDALTRGERIVAIVREQLSKRQSIHTRELVSLIENTGLSIPAANKVVAVSQVLGGRKNEFLTSRKTGWSLVKRPKGESENHKGEDSGKTGV